MTKARRHPAPLALLALCGGLLGLAAPAMAQGYYDHGPGRGPGYAYGYGPGPNYIGEMRGLDQWEHRAQGWLVEGVRTGTLTPREADRARWALDGLRHQEREATRDGFVSRGEYQALRAQAAQVEDMLQRGIHDRQTIPPMPYGTYHPGRTG